MEHNTDKICKIAFFVTDKKLFLHNLLLEYLKQTDGKINGKKIEMVILDIEKPIKDIFDIMFHKLEQTIFYDKDSKFQNLCSYHQNNPLVLYIDPIEKVKQVIDRKNMGSLFDQINFKLNEHLVLGAQTHFLTVNKKITQEFCYPQIIKGLNGDNHEHKFCFTKEGLDIVVQQFNTCITQTYLFHNAIIYKIYVIGDATYVFKRPSFEDNEIKEMMLSKKQFAPVPRFSVPKKDFDSTLNSADPNIHFFNKVSNYISQVSGLQIFGYDLVTETDTKKHYVVDINYVPSFRGIDPNELSKSFYSLIQK